MSAPAPGRQTGSFGAELTNAAMIGLIGVFALTLLLRGAGSVAAFLTGTAQPLAGPAAGVGVLFNPGDPATALEADGLSVVAYWIVAVVLLGLLATLLLVCLLVARIPAGALPRPPWWFWALLALAFLPNFVVGWPAVLRYAQITAFAALIVFTSLLIAWTTSFNEIAPAVAAWARTRRSIVSSPLRSISSPTGPFCASSCDQPIAITRSGASSRSAASSAGSSLRATRRTRAPAAPASGPRSAKSEWAAARSSGSVTTGAGGIPASIIARSATAEPSTAPISTVLMRPPPPGRAASRPASPARGAGSASR